MTQERTRSGLSHTSKEARSGLSPLSERTRFGLSDSPEGRGADSLGEFDGRVSDSVADERGREGDSLNEIAGAFRTEDAARFRLVLKQILNTVTTPEALDVTIKHLEKNTPPAHPEPLWSDESVAAGGHWHLDRLLERAKSERVEN